MKKLIIISLIFALSISLSGVASAGYNVTTGLTSDTSGGTAPIVKAKWEAYINRYSDESSAAGAQFMPSGVKDQVTTISLCAIVTDPDGLSDIDAVYADVFYPENVELGDSHIPLTDQSGLGCGLLMQEDSLTRLSKADGIELFCNQVRNNNPNLPTFNNTPTLYDYDEICAIDGELMKETAAVYCGEKDLSYEDPSGEYKVWAVAQDGNGLQGILENHFDYLALTAFQTDFSKVEYGNVRLNTHKIINGDLTWDTMDQGKASVRNVGNTRLTMKVWQDDMGLGETDGLWNVRYDARVGSNASFANYFPEQTKTLADQLDLSELDEMDFSVEIFKFPPTHTGDDYIGTMTLGAVAAPHLICQGVQPEWRTVDLENKTDQWVIIPGDGTEGDIDYYHNDTSFNGIVTGQGLDPNSKYQVALNGPGACTATDTQLAGAPGNLFSTGFWEGGPNLVATCTGSPGEGIHNMDLISDWYTVITDGNGDFSHPFDIALPQGDYVGVKVVVKKMLDPYVSPWQDQSTPWPQNGLFEELWKQKKQNAINFAKDQEYKPYDWHWYEKSVDPDSLSWYCSELVWAAYYHQNINLDYKDKDGGIVSPVSPFEIYMDDDTYVVSENVKNKGIFKNYLFLMILSPIQVTVTDPDGNIVTKDIINIPGATYLEDYVDPDTGQVYDMISLPNITGEYQITVIPEPGAGPDEIYNLIIKVGDEQTVLAQDVRVADIPDKPYIVQGTLGAGNDGFDDTENSSQNSFTAGTLDFSLSPASLGNVDLNAYEYFDLLKDGSLDFEYSLEAQVSGDLDFCNDLNLLIYENNILKYNNKLENLSVAKIITGAQDEWKFILDDTAQHYVGKTCNFDFIFKAWQTGLDYNHGLTDTETISGSVNSGVPLPAPDIVLNEFLPNPIGSDNAAMPNGEWVELYNNSDESVDVAGWYLYDDHDSHDLEITSTNTDLATTTIAAHSWLVVYRNGNGSFSLNNTSDKVRLYNGTIDAGSLIDSYEYDGRDFHDLTPTHGEENIDDSSGGSAQSIPENKSFARIPDGTGDWVDPVPTPGQANEIFSSD